MSKQRVRRVGSFKQELVKKSREAALAAVQVFNNPSITFKSEIYSVLMVIAWTYLMHAFYRDKKIEYRYCDLSDGGRKKFHTTSRGAQKYWELEHCLNYKSSPVDKDTSNNLRFMIELRHEIEHQMTTRIDNLLSARFQACCLNYNDYIKKLFGDSQGIDKHLSFSLQFSSISKGQIDELGNHENLPKSIQGFIDGFDGKLSDIEFNSPKFAYRVLFIPKLANNKGQADQVIEFIKADSELAQQINAKYAVIKETERDKFLPAQIVKLMQEEGFPEFNLHAHTQFWQASDAKNSKHAYGTQVVKQWYWYKKWLDVVRNHCQGHSATFQ